MILPLVLAITNAAAFVALAMPASESPIDDV